MEASRTEMASEGAAAGGGAWGEYRRRVKYAVWVVAAVAGVGVLLWTGFRVLLLGAAGVLLAVFLYRVASWVARVTRLPYWAALVVVCVVLAAGVVGAGWLAGARISGQVDALRDQLPQAWGRVEDYLRDREWGRWVIGRARRAWESEQGGLVASGVGYLSTAGTVVAEGLVILFVGLFGAVRPEMYVRGMVRLVPVKRRAGARRVLEGVGEVMWWWLVGQLVAMAFIGVVTGVTVWGLGVPLALTLGLIAAVLNFVPNFGPVLAAAPAMMLGLLVGPWTALWVGVAYVGIQLVQNHVVTPVVQQRAVNLPPVLLLLGQVLLYAWAGLLGMAMAPVVVAVGMRVVEEVYVKGWLGDEMREGRGEGRQKDEG